MMSERKLGETAEVFALELSEDVREVSLALATQARRSLDIVTRHLDVVLYDNEAFANAMRELVVDSRRAQVRILVLDSGQVVTHGHRLIELARRLSSFISVKVPAPEHKDFNEAWLVADTTGYLHRRFSDRYEATANFADRRHSANLANRFNELWNHALQDPNFRRLHL